MSGPVHLTRAMALVSLCAMLAGALSPPARGWGGQSSLETRQGGGVTQQTPASARDAASQAKSEKRDNQDSDVVRVDTELTNILFTAIDRNRSFVNTLRREDLRVSENGSVQEIFAFQRETDLPLSLSILIDTSKSEEATLPEEKAAALDFVRTVLRPGKDSAAIVSFTGEPTLEQAPTGDLARLQKAIEGVQIVLPPERVDRDADPRDDPRGWTAIWDAIWVTSRALMERTPEQTRRAIILLTDGDNTYGKIQRQEAVDAAIKANTVIYAIGIGDPKHYSVDKQALKKIADQTGGRAFFPRGEADLHASFTQLEEELRSQYLVAYAPTNRTPDGAYRQVRLEIVNPELRKRKLLLLYRQGYYARRAAAAQAR